jgi:hypothetical protein
MFINRRRAINCGIRMVVFYFEEYYMRRLTRIGIKVLPSVAEVAYFLWLNGSDDTLKNWYDAKKIVKNKG